ncbi:MAG: methyl-accepting chemotaxis protein [Bryobacteraceae bacterium]
MKNVTLGPRIMAAVGVMFAMAVIIGACGMWAIDKLENRLRIATDQMARKIELAGAINTATSDMYVAQRGMFLQTMIRNREGIEKAKEDYHRSGADAEQALREILPLLDSNSGRELAARIQENLKTWQDAAVELMKMCEAGNGAGAVRRGLQTSFPLYQKIGRDAVALVELQQAALARERNDAASDTAWSRWLMMAVLAVLVGIGVVIFLLVRASMRELQRLSRDMKENAEQVAGAAGQVAAASQSLAQGASEQAASIEETSASGEEITSVTRKNSENTQTAAELMGDVDQRVAEANRMLEQMVVSMREINSSSDKIAHIIKVIDEIAFQTNILALNAAVEAARAGEAGMGFAVVADEVRNLAQRSAQAAKDTAGLIQESIKTSAEGKSRLDQVTGAIQAITEAASQVKTLVDEVNIGSKEQSRGIEQIARAIQQMEQVTQNVAASAEESASSSEELSAMAGSMKDAAQRLEQMVGAEERDSAGRPLARKLLTRMKSSSTAKKPGSEGARVSAATPPRSSASAAPSKERASTSKPRAATAVLTKPGPETFPMDEDFKEF